MVAQQDNRLLEIPEVGKEEYTALQVSLVQRYLQQPQGTQDREWLFQTLRSHLPESIDDELRNFVHEAENTIKQNNDMLVSAEDAKERGEDLQNWFGQTVQNASQTIGTVEMANRLQSIDSALGRSTANLLDAATTRNGGINQCANLDGFLAEQQHVETFNLDAKLSGSSFRARVRQPRQ